MPTYYDILQTSPQATAAEIEEAYEKQYNHWRRLVTHHDSNVANEANQALHLLEEARATLIDPQRRVTYDASLRPGGLADPMAQPSSASPLTLLPTLAPSSPSAPPPKSIIVAPPPLKPEERVDVWLCPKCKKTNAIGVQFCRECGHTIGISCPQCKCIIEATAKFCPSCGINVPQTLRRNELNAALAQKQNEMTAVGRIDPRHSRADAISTLRVATIAAGAWMGLSVIGSLVLGVGWDWPLQIPAVLGEMIPRAIIFIFYLLFVFGVTIARMRFSFSALVAVASTFALLVTPFAAAFLIGYQFGLQIHTPLITLCYAGISALCALSLLGLWINLSRYGCWTGLVTLLAWLATMTALAPRIVAVIPVFLPYQEYALIADYFVFALPMGIASYLLLAVCFAIFGLLAWRGTQRTEHELAVALAEKQERLSRIEGEIKKLSSELATL